MRQLILQLTKIYPGQPILLASDAYRVYSEREISDDENRINFRILFRTWFKKGAVFNGAC